jgi:hypothetical protein
VVFVAAVFLRDVGMHLRVNERDGCDLRLRRRGVFLASGNSPTHPNDSGIYSTFGGLRPARDFFTNSGH